VHRGGTGAGRGVQEVVGGEVGADPRADVGGLGVQRPGVFVGRHRDGGQPERVERARDAHRDLAAVGDQDRSVHGHPPAFAGYRRAGDEGGSPWGDPSVSTRDVT
jgi:hypothetical protein